MFRLDPAPLISKLAKLRHSAHGHMPARSASSPDPAPPRSTGARRALTFIPMPMPMPKPVCSTCFNITLVQYEVCVAVLGRGMGMNITAPFGSFRGSGSAKADGRKKRFLAEHYSQKEMLCYAVLYYDILYSTIL